MSGVLESMRLVSMHLLAMCNFFFLFRISYHFQAYNIPATNITHFEIKKRNNKDTLQIVMA